MFILLFLMPLLFAIYFVFIGISSYLFIDTLQMTPLIYSYLFIIIAMGYFAW